MDNSDTIKLVILGEPLAQKRHKHTSRDQSGKPLPFTRTYDPSKKDKYNIRQIAQLKAPPRLLMGPIRVDCYFYFGYLKGHYGTGKNIGRLKDSAPYWKDTGKDRDNCDKLILDALTGVFFPNDSQVCAGEIKKKYSEKPRTEIYITPLNKQKELFE